MQILDCYNNLITQLDKLPSFLRELNCSNNQITQLDNLPSYLQELNCSGNQIIQLDNLPYSLRKLNCQWNRITQLDNLPISLQILYCYSNQMEHCDLKYWKEQTEIKKLELLKKKFCVRKIQKQWRKYWYEFYKYEIINEQNIGFCRFIEKIYFYYNQ